ncbi:dihydroneopterin aldolase [Candidatus Acetothermia bacterium]|jgi:dihydroneopterin aldolase|nr:dihydroneopterin aldolase [Candidatus Acetothermia bacterium]MCI2426474.1 dihydroneopterin aldolase [Candidatus Acetothermia bacterium]MCI2427197.1 dihydroneopterin aldolase [Candidatus Acetothermia bacterium]MCI2428585.1 dihydroneopterin aldolase [Candidatus Acetothermia bacterium]
MVILKEIKISLTGLELTGFHGYTEQERQQKNRFRIDLQIEGDFATALASGSLEDTVDYSIAAETVCELNAINRYKLIESFANDIADSLLTRSPRARRIAVRVTKIDPPGLAASCNATVELVKERNGD